jgi:hypothetical protein
LHVRDVGEDRVTAIRVAHALSERQPA